MDAPVHHGSVTWQDDTNFVLYDRGVGKPGTYLRWSAKMRLCIRRWPAESEYCPFTLISERD